MSAEGELALTLRWDGHEVHDVAVSSTRPDVAAAVLAGRTPAEALALVPRVFSICGDSQRIAAGLALRAAGAPVADAADAAAALRDEAVREYAFRALLDWPRIVGEPEDAATLRELRTGAADVHDRVAQRVFGQGAASWLGIASPAAFDRWLERGDTTAARLLGTLRYGDGGFGQSDTALLPVPDAAGATRLAEAMRRDERFCRLPTWHGAPAETGALARRASDPMVADLRSRFGNSVLARLAARLRELAGLLGGTMALRAGAVGLGGGHGLGWVENARGLLVHVATLVDGRVSAYRILAPTEWNFHPQGPLAGGLRGTRYASEADLRHRAGLIVQSLDPCVACRIELGHA
jgi:coenzyme F420-reducing hydrogenase alpha subunit